MNVACSCVFYRIDEECYKSDFVSHCVVLSVGRIPGPFCLYL